MKNQLCFLLPLFLALNLMVGPVRLSGQNHALFFAVERYQDPRIGKAPHAIQDAMALAEVLGARFGFQVEVVENPTTEAIGEKLKEYHEHFIAGRLPKNGQLLIYFVGRGIEVGGEGYFLAADADTSRLNFSALAWNNWLKEISRLDCRHILVVAEAEHSGAIRPGWESNSQGRRVFLEDGRNRRYLKNAWDYQTRVMLALEPDRDVRAPRSSLSKLFREGLVSMAEEYNYIAMEDVTEYLYKKQFGRVTPLSFEGDYIRSNFLFIPQPIQPKPPSEKEGLWQLVQQQNTLEAYSFYARLYPGSKNGNEALLRIDTFPDTLATADGRWWKALPDPPAEARDGLVLIKGGTFTPGNLEDNNLASARSGLKITVPDFYLSPVELTFEQFQEFCYATRKTLPHDMGWGRGNRPVINVDWYDAVEFCNWLSKKRGLEPVYQIDQKRKDPNSFSFADQKKWVVTFNRQANGYRLPTVSEWEYAARSGGKAYRYAWVQEQTSHANIADESAKRAIPGLETMAYYNDGYPFTAPVGSFRQGHLGLSDLNGNVFEWCWDWAYPGFYEGAGPVHSPVGPEKGAFRAFRGGAWDTPPEGLPVAFPYAGSPSLQRSNLGFRLARNAR